MDRWPGSNQVMLGISIGMRNRFTGVQSRVDERLGICGIKILKFDIFARSISKDNNTYGMTVLGID